MKKIKVLAFLLLGSSMMVSAQSIEKIYTVTGDIEGLKTANNYMYMRGTINGKFTTDSVQISNGHFVFSGKAEPVMVTIFSKRVNKLHTINPMQLFLDEGNIKITAKYDTTSYSYLKDVKIEGSANQLEYERFNEGMRPIYTGIDFGKMQADYKAANAVKDTAKTAAISKVYAGLNEKRNIYTADYVKAHPKSFISLSAISEMVIQPNEKILAAAKSMFMTLDPALQFSANGKKVTDRMIFSSKGMLIGKPSGDFSQPTAEGKMVKLSNYKGKYVLLDFWASWCGPCRAENPNVLKNYKQFKDKGFDILAVSLDDSKLKWEKAIAEDHLPWTQVSDLKQSKNAAVQQFGVAGIPDNFLIDPNGIVIARGLRGDALDKKLAEVFKGK